MSDINVTRLNTVESGGYYVNENHTGREHIFLDSTSRTIVDAVLTLESELMLESSRINLGLSDTDRDELIQKYRRMIKAHTDSLKSHMDGKEEILTEIPELFDLFFIREKEFKDQEKTKYAGRGLVMLAEDELSDVSGYRFKFSRYLDCVTPKLNEVRKKAEIFDPTIYSESLSGKIKETLDNNNTRHYIVVFLGNSIDRSDIEPLIGLNNVSVFVPNYTTDRYNQIVQFLVSSKTEVYRYD